jgi:tetratricopeptide (TPR) repeat protein
LALAQADPAQWITPAERENILEGKRHLDSARDYGLFENTEGLARLAWIEYLSGNTEESVRLLTEAAKDQQGQAKALSLYYRGALLNRLGRYELARRSLDEALMERPDLILALEEKGESLWQLGLSEQAITAWSEAINRNNRLVLANNQLAGAAASLGKSAEAVSYAKQADQFTPDDPYYHWMIGLRLRNLRMNELAQKHFQRAIQLDPSFQLRLQRGN